MNIIDFPIEKIFATSLLSGFLYSLLLYLTGGRIRVFSKSFLRLGSKFKMRLPKMKLTRRNAVVQDFAPPWMMPILIGAFLVLFGMTGLVLKILFEVSASVSLVGAVASGVILSTAVLVLAQKLLSDSGSELRGSALYGTIGHVSLTIPESGVGSIAYVQDGKRVTMPARSKEGSSISKGQQIVIVDLLGKIALVEQF